VAGVNYVIVVSGRCFVALPTPVSLPSILHLWKAYQDNKNDKHRLLTFTTIILMGITHDEPKILRECLLR
jgi:hypothetical protein